MGLHSGVKISALKTAEVDEHFQETEVVFL